jgi:hypothetical protein
MGARSAVTHIVNIHSLRQTRAERQTLCRAGFQPLRRIPATAPCVALPSHVPVGRCCPRPSHIPVQHKWQVVNDRRFEVKAGKVLTAERCRRCGVPSVCPQVYPCLSCTDFFKNQRFI